MYLVKQAVIKKDNDLYSYLDNYARLSKLLYNASLFRVRQIFTAYDKPDADRTANERGVLSEACVLQDAYPSIHIRRVISYRHLEKMMRVTMNPDFFSGLPMQTAQAVVRSACTDFSNWLKALKSYKESPQAFLGRPQMPNYKRTDVCTYTITNQDAVLCCSYGKDGATAGCGLKLPGRKSRYLFSNLAGTEHLKEVKVKPYYGRYILSLTLETADTVTEMRPGNKAGIDFGVDNIAAIACTDGTSVIYKGGAVLSENQKYAKLRARYTGIITKGHSRKSASSVRLTNISYHHANFKKDQLHKISASIIRWCTDHRVSSLVLGVNRSWKQESSMGKVNNQNFVQMPFAQLQEMILYKAENAGIQVIIQEESYTSRADLTAGDPIPVYGEKEPVSFSGERICRGLYRSHDGQLFNADCHAAANILRKAIPDVWSGRTDFRFLTSPEVSGFHELNPQSIAQKAIA